MALHTVLIPLRAGLAVLCLAAASGAGAGDLARSTPLVLAQSDPDPMVDEGQGGGSEAAALLVRITRLEDQLRTLTGQVEQLQFQNKKLDDQMRKMQQDVDFRFQDLGRTPIGGARPAPVKKGDAGSGTATDLADATPMPDQTPPVMAASSTKHAGDAFDPASDAGAPGAPRPLGTTPPSRPLPNAAVVTSAEPPALASTPHAPLDLTPSAQRPEAVAALPAQDATLVPNVGARVAPSPPGAAGSTRTEYDGSLTLYKGGQFDAAIEGFQGFVQKYPKDRLVPDATYFLGESYAKQGRQREAAEQFLKLSTDYARSNRAPDALLRLGVALNALGAKEQACATYQEVDRKFPTASSDVRSNVERELKRAKC